jgi:FtsZ-binding cell division protein ZapB
VIAKHKVESPEDRPKKRRKVACDICHHHHKKCDGKSPCGRCTSKGYKCTYNQRRHSTIAALQKEIDNLKQKIHFYENTQLEFKKKMNTLHEENNSLIHFEFEQQTIPLLESPMHTMNDFSKRFIYTDVTLHLCSIVSGFLNIYFATCYPHHYLLPSNFEQMVPELMKTIVTSPNERNDNVFLLFAIITNSALIFNDRRRAEEFFHRALECSQYLNFYQPSYALAYAYCHLSYFSTCYGRSNDAYSYSLMAKNMGEVLNMKDSDMYGEALMRMGFASQNIHEKQMLFTELWKRKSNTDKVNVRKVFLMNEIVIGSSGVNCN